MKEDEPNSVVNLFMNLLGNFNEKDLLVSNEKLIKLSIEGMDLIKQELPYYEKLRVSYTEMYLNTLIEKRREYAMDKTDEEYFKLTGDYKCPWCSTNLIIKGYCDDLCKKDYDMILNLEKKINKWGDENG